MISKLANMRKGDDKCRLLKMHSKIRELWTKIISTTNKKEKQSKHNTKDSQQITKEGEKRPKVTIQSN